MNNVKSMYEQWPAMLVNATTVGTFKPPGPKPATWLPLRRIAMKAYEQEIDKSDLLVQRRMVQAIAQINVLVFRNEVVKCMFLKTYKQ